MLAKIILSGEIPEPSSAFPLKNRLFRLPGADVDVEKFYRLAKIISYISSSKIEFSFSLTHKLITFS